MVHNCFISFKKEDEHYRDTIVNALKSERIPGKSLDKWIDSEDIDYVMQRIREDYMKGSSVTLYLIGKHSSEKEGKDSQGKPKQSFMIRELQATLYDGKNNRRSGLLGIVLPDMEQNVFGKNDVCPKCNHTVGHVNVNDDTVLREFSKNYWLRKGDCDHFDEDGRFCVLVRYSEFMNDPEKYIDMAFKKTQSDIAKYVHFRDIDHIDY